MDRVDKGFSNQVEFAVETRRAHFINDVCLEMQRKGWKVKELAKALGVKKRYVRGVLREDYELCLEEMAEIALALGRTLKVEIVDHPGAGNMISDEPEGSDHIDDFVVNEVDDIVECAAVLQEEIVKLSGLSSSLRERLALPPM